MSESADYDRFMGYDQPDDDMDDDHEIMCEQRPTVNLRFLDGKLQQEWEVDVRIDCDDRFCAMGWHTVTRKEWRHVASATSERSAPETAEDARMKGKKE
jgi:hypothetical protein